MTGAAGETPILVVPGLCGPVPRLPEPFPALPALDRLLGRADSSPWPESDPLGSLLGLCGLRPDPAHGSPSAALCRLGDAPEARPEAGGWWLHADPVHLHADLDRLRLCAVEPSAAEAEALVALLNSHFAEEGLAWSAPHPCRWYLRLDTATDLRTRPLSAVLGEPLTRDDLGGQHGALWARRQTEAQMLLHAAESNQARARRGQAAINGVWIWGGGALPETPPARLPARLIGDHPLLRGLARWGGCEYRALDAAGPLAARDGAWLLYDEGPAEALRARDLDAWLAALQRLDQRLGDSWEGGPIRLIDPLAGRQWRLSNGARWRWWRGWRAQGGLRRWIDRGAGAHV
ncbi:MAG: phosphoglycerate mutase [Chromatiaceae bacterium]|nr:phosphoglycerate mutase [Chromatiaceae bacterium]